MDTNENNANESTAGFANLEANEQSSADSQILENANSTPEMQSKKGPNWFVHFIVALIILTAGVGVAVVLIKLKKEPEKKETPYLAPLVSTQEVKAEDVRVSVYGFGNVEPKTEVQIIPQVSGQVVECHPNLVNGGFFKANQTLITIDQRDYQAAVNSAEAAVATARLTLDQEIEEAAIAKQEWQQMNPGREPTSALVFRGPQIEKAKAGLKAAEAQLETAKVNLERTVISLPFNGRVSQESVDLGQFVSPGQSLGSVYGTDVMEIVVPLEDKNLAWFSVPNGTSKEGSPVDVKANYAGSDWHWEGKVVRTEGNIDPISRMVKVVIEIDKPFEGSDGKPALVPGMFVEIEIKGKMLKDVIALPRYVIHDSDKVWVAEEKSFANKEIEFLSEENEEDTNCYVTSGLENGDVLVTSPKNNSMSDFSFLKISDKTYIEKDIDSQEGVSVICVPKSAVEPNGVMTVNGYNLTTQNVDFTISEDGQDAYITSGLNPGDLVVTTPDYSDKKFLTVLNVDENMIMDGGNLIRIPRYALSYNNEILAADKYKPKERKIQVLKKEVDFVYIAKTTFSLPFKDGDMIAISPYDVNSDEIVFQVISEDSFVSVTVDDKQYKNVLKVPSKAVRDDMYIKFSKKQKLKPEVVDIVKQDDKFAYVKCNLKAGSWIQVTPFEDNHEVFVKRITNDMVTSTEVNGSVINNAIKIPRCALNQQKQVNVFNYTGLKVSKIEISRSDDKTAYIKSGIEDGELIIMSPMDSVTDGMTIRTE